MLPRILVGADFTSENRAAFNWAVRLARLSGAQLMLVHAVPPSDSFSMNARQRLVDFAELRDIAKDNGVPVTVRVQHGRAARVIALHARSLDAQLLVLGTNGRKGWSRFRKRSIAEQVLRRASVPVFVVPSDDDSRRGQSGHILAAVDFSPASHAALAEAVRLTRTQGGQLTVLHVVKGVESSRIKRAGWHPVVPEYRTALMRDATRQLEKAIPSEHRADIALKTRVVAGVPHTEILRVTSELGAGLVIVGATTRRVSRGFDSTTNRIVRGAKVPVLVVPQVDIKNTGLLAAPLAAAA
jgi:nucleotide-binding universal stress UspA family protein